MIPHERFDRKVVPTAPEIEMSRGRSRDHDRINSNVFQNVGPVYPVAATSLQEAGVRAGDKLGLIWNEGWNDRAARGTYIPRLLKAKIVVEETNADDFWKLDLRARDKAVEKMRAARIKGILTYGIPTNLQNGWKDLGHTGYFTLIF